MNIRKNIPNTITLGNLLCGCLAIVKAFEGDLVWAAYLVGLAAVFDFLDGLVARLLKVQSPVGKDLDSLADMVTFGVVPGVVMYMMIKQSMLFETMPDWPAEGGEIGTEASRLYWPYVGFVITIFSCIRLALFNNDTRQSEEFIGLPTPANAIFICSLPLLIHLDNDFSFQQVDSRLLTLVLDSDNLCIVTGFLSLLLVTELPLFSLKFKNFSWGYNRLRYMFLLLCVILLALFGIAGITLIIIAYISISFVNNIFSNKRV